MDLYQWLNFVMSWHQDFHLDSEGKSRHLVEYEVEYFQVETLEIAVGSKLLIKISIQHRPLPNQT